MWCNLVTLSSKIGGNSSLNLHLVLSGQTPIDRLGIRVFTTRGSYFRHPLVQILDAVSESGNKYFSSKILSMKMTMKMPQFLSQFWSRLLKGEYLFLDETLQ